MSEQTRKLFTGQLKVINVGVQSFADALIEQDVTVEQVEWRPPVQEDSEISDLLDKLL